MKKKLFLIAGYITFILGLIGILVPILPTTPFLLLSAASFMRSSDKMYQWLMKHPWFGKYIRDFRESKAIPLGAKLFSVSLLWVTILFSIIFISECVHIRILLAVIAIAVSIHILHYKTLEE